MEKDPALLNVVLLEDVKKGPSDLVEEDSVLFLFKQFWPLRKKQEHHRIDVFLGDYELRSVDAAKKLLGLRADFVAGQLAYVLERRCRVNQWP